MVKYTPYTGCPKKGGTLDFRYFDIRKYSILIWSDKALSSKKNDKIIWFGSLVLILQPFLEIQSFTNFDKSMRAICGGYMAVHKFSLYFVCTDQWASRQQCMEVRKTIFPDWNVTRMKRKFIMTMFWEMTIVSNYSTMFNNIGIVLIGRQCFIWWNRNMLYFRISKWRQSSVPLFGGTPGITYRLNWYVPEL